MEFNIFNKKEKVQEIKPDIELKKAEVMDLYSELKKYVEDFQVSRFAGGHASSPDPRWVIKQHMIKDLASITGEVDRIIKSDPVDSYDLLFVEKQINTFKEKHSVV